MFWINLKSEKFIIYINLMAIGIIYILLLIVNLTQHIYGHDFFWPYYVHIENAYFPSPRVIPLIITKLYNITLPHIFNIHPHDFKINIFVCLITGFIYISLLLIMVKGFYIFSNIKQNILKRKEISMLSLLCFFSIFMDYPQNKIFVMSYDVIFMGKADNTVFFEHCLGLILYFLLFSILVNILFNENKCSKFNIFHIILSFVVSVWSEFINLPAIVGIILLTLIWKIKNSLSKTENFKFPNQSKLMLISFFIGLLCFYVLSGKYANGNIGSIENYDIIGRIPENLKLIKDFSSNFFADLIYLPKIYFIISFLTVFFTINFVICSEKENIRKYILNILITYIPIVSFLFISFGTIFISNYRQECSAYLFQLTYFEVMEYPIWIFTLLMQMGLLYNILNNRNKECVWGKKAFIASLVIGTVFLGAYFKGCYCEYINMQIKDRQELYKLEKIIAVYSVLNEPILISENFLNNKYIEMDFLPKVNEDDYIIIDYINYLYSNYLGIKIVDSETAENEYNKRLQLLEKIEDKYNIFGQIQFTPLLNIKKIN